MDNPTVIVTLHLCGTCRHYKRVDARAIINDPDGFYQVCAWEPPHPRPYWLPPPYLHEGIASLVAATRTPTDGVECPAWSPRDV